MGVPFGGVPGIGIIVYGGLCFKAPHVWKLPYALPHKSGSFQNCVAPILGTFFEGYGHFGSILGAPDLGTPRHAKLIP